MRLSSSISRYTRALFFLCPSQERRPTTIQGDGYIEARRSDGKARQEEENLSASFREPPRDSPPPILRARARTKEHSVNVPGFLTLAEIAAGLRGPVSFARVLLLRRIRKQARVRPPTTFHHETPRGKGDFRQHSGKRRRHISILPGETRLGNASGFGYRERERRNKWRRKQEEEIADSRRFHAPLRLHSFVLSDLINVSRNAKPRYR